MVFLGMPGYKTTFLRWLDLTWFLLSNGHDALLGKPLSGTLIFKILQINTFGVIKPRVARSGTPGQNNNCC
jgi:hypothetical protein